MLTNANSFTQEEPVLAKSGAPPKSKSNEIEIVRSSTENNS